MKYKVKIVETLSKIVEVEAQSSSKALEKVGNMYLASEVVLDETDFDGYELYVQ